MQFKKFKPSRSKAASYISSFMPALEFLSFERINFVMFTEGMACLNGNCIFPLRAGDKKSR
jgi:hypothetical protein